MTTMLVWLLVSVSHYSQVTVVERFADKEECTRVRELLPYEYRDQKAQTRCIQARIVVATPHG